MNLKNPMGVLSFNEIVFSQEHSLGSIITKVVNLL
jgi:hypothetical protein